MLSGKRGTFWSPALPAKSKHLLNKWFDPRGHFMRMEKNVKNSSAIMTPTNCNADCSCQFDFTAIQSCLTLFSLLFVETSITTFLGCETIEINLIAMLNSSSSPVELSTALILIISNHPPPTPTHPRDSSNEALPDYLGWWNLVWKRYSTKLGQLAT